MKSGWKGRSRGGGTGYRIFLFLLNRAGLGTAYVLLSIVVLYYIPASPSSSVNIWRYARRILGYGPFKSAFFIYRNYFAFGQSIIDKVAISSGMKDKFTFSFDGADPVFDVFNKGEGVITVGAHFGNWAAGEPYFRRYGTRLNVVMYDNENEDIKKVIEQNSEYGKSFKVIPVNKDNLAHVFMITEALDAGEAVSFLGDRYVNDEKLLNINFLGRDVNFPAGPFLLASKMNVPVYFYFAERGRGRRYTFRFVKAGIPKGRSRDAAMSVLQQYTAALEREILACPEQWYNFYDFWEFRK